MNPHEECTSRDIRLARGYKDSLPCECIPAMVGIWVQCRVYTERCIYPRLSILRYLETGIWKGTSLSDYRGYLQAIRHPALLKCQYRGIKIYST